MFKNILVPVDFSDRATVATHVAALWAAQFSSHVELIHVLETAPYAYPPIWPGEAPLFAELETLAKKAAETRLTDIAATLAREGLEGVSTVLDTGSIVERIQERATSSHVELIVAASQGRTGFERLLLGSTCERLLRHAPCPVLVVRASASAAPPEIRKVLVAIDLSPHSRRAVEVAARVAERWGAALHLFHAWPAPYPLADIQSDGDIFSRLCRAAESEVLAFVATCSLPSGVKPVTTIASGTPVAALARHLEALDPDLLCLGTHGRSGPKHLILGSVAEATVRTATCATLVVP